MAAVAALFAFSGLQALAASAPEISAPEISASWVTDVTSTSAVLRAEVNPEGLASGVHFEYISDSAYRANLEAGHDGFLGAIRVPREKDIGVGAGSAPVAVFQNLIGPLNPLIAATSYRYRPIAANAAGTAVGAPHLLTTTEEGASFSLPDGRAWELVSPADKAGGAIAGPGGLFGGGAIQASAAGAAVTYGSSSSFGAAAGAPPASQYLSRRGVGEWTTENISAPTESGSYGSEPDGVPYRLFSGELAAGLLYGGSPCRGVPGCSSAAPPLPGSGAPAGYATYYLRREPGGNYTSLLTAADLAHTAVSPEHFQLSLAAATPDLTTVILSSCSALTADATEVAPGPGECGGGDRNLYRWSGGGLALVNLLPGESTGTAGATIAARIGAVSEDGKRVYFTSSDDGLLYLREFGGPTRWVEETLPGRASFQVASADGSVAFLLISGHLYRYTVASSTAADLTPGGEVAGVLAASANGERVYFQDAGGLELWEEGQTRLVAPGADAALSSDYPPAAATVRLSADGRHLAFLSAAEIGGYDNRDAETGSPDAELYLYDSGGGGSLRCASCNPTGERPRGAAAIPGAEPNGTTALYRPRVFASDSRRLFFDSSDRLVIADTNSRPDVYEWEAAGEGACARSQGCVTLLSSGRGTGGATFLDADADGSDVFFLTDESLVGADPGSIDVYDARVGGGLPEPPAPFSCLGDACQALPNPPEDPSPGTLVPNGGNPPLQIVHQKPRHRHGKKHRRKKRHRHHRRGQRRPPA